MREEEEEVRGEEGVCLGDTTGEEEEGKEGPGVSNGTRSLFLEEGARTRNSS